MLCSIEYRDRLAINDEQSWYTRESGGNGVGVLLRANSLGKRLEDENRCGN